jgi:hypothetical protein
METAISVSCRKNSLLWFIKLQFIPAMFCDQKCMNKARKRFHDVECEISEQDSQNFQSEIDGYAITLVTLRAMVEAFRMAGSVQRLRELMNPETEENIFDFDLSHEVDETMETKHLKVLSILQGVLTEEEIVTIVNNPSSSNLILEPSLRKLFPIAEDFNFMIDFTVRFDSIRQCNAIPLSRVKASGILPFGSFFNHSCDPNVERITVFGNKTVSVVMKPVKKGEQLLITYSSTMIYSTAPIEKRQEEIFERYRFDCSCFACINNLNFATSLTFPSFDENFIRAARFPDNYKDLIKDFKRNCAYIKKNFKHFPSIELFALLCRNFNILGTISDICAQPAFAVAPLLQLLSF